MIYTAFGLPVFKIKSGDIKKNKVKLIAYGGEKHGFEEYDRTVHELKADNGIHEIHEAVRDPFSYKPTVGDVVDYFDKYCK